MLSVISVAVYLSFISYKFPNSEFFNANFTYSTPDIAMCGATQNTILVPILCNIIYHFIIMHSVLTIWKLDKVGSIIGLRIASNSLCWLSLPN